MIKIVSSRVVKEDCVEQFLAIARELVEASCAEEGNIEYTLNRSTQDPRKYCFLEKWRDQDALDAHNNSEHFQRLVPQMRTLAEEGTSNLDLYTEV